MLCRLRNDRTGVCAGIAEISKSVIARSAATRQSVPGRHQASGTRHEGKRGKLTGCHCEERSDVAIRSFFTWPGGRTKETGDADCHVTSVATLVPRNDRTGMVHCPTGRRRRAPSNRGGAISAGDRKGRPYGGDGRGALPHGPPGTSAPTFRPLMPHASLPNAYSPSCLPS